MKPAPGGLHFRVWCYLLNSAMRNWTWGLSIMNYVYFVVFLSSLVSSGNHFVAFFTWIFGASCQWETSTGAQSLSKTITFILPILFSQDMELKSCIEISRKMELRYGHWFDNVIIPETMDITLTELLTIATKLEREPSWVPRHWLYWLPFAPRSSWRFKKQEWCFPFGQTCILAWVKRDRSLFHILSILMLVSILLRRFHGNVFAPVNLSYSYNFSTQSSPTNRSSCFFLPNAALYG